MKITFRTTYSFKHLISSFYLITLQHLQHLHYDAPLPSNTTTFTTTFTTYFLPQWPYRPRHTPAGSVITNPQVRGTPRWAGSWWCGHVTGRGRDWMVSGQELHGMSSCSAKRLANWLPDESTLQYYLHISVRLPWLRTPSIQRFLYLFLPSLPLILALLITLIGLIKWLSDSLQYSIMFPVRFPWQDYCIQLYLHPPYSPLIFTL